MNEKLKDHDILLVKEKGSNDLKAAKMDGNGKITQAKPDSANPDLLKIDRYGNILDNFFENFQRQVKEPTRFEFFRVPAVKLNDALQQLQVAFKDPDNSVNKEFIEMHRIDANDFLKKQGQEQTAENKYAIDPDLVKWDKLEKFGITREALEKSGNLEKLLDYRKTDLLTTSIKLDDGETTIRTDARYSLRKQEDGSFVPAIHPIRHKPDLEHLYFGITFTEVDKQNLLKSGNLGRVVEAEFQQGVKTPVLLSLDKLTNELVAYRADRLKVPDTIKGVQLTGKQKEMLSNGEAVYLEDMTSKNGKSFSASVQFNADKRSLEFLFDNEKKQTQKQENEQKEVPKTFRKKVLAEDQRDSLREGKTVYVDGLKDTKGKAYSGYITLNNENGKLDFMFAKNYKEAVAAGKVIPDNRSKTQVDVNSEGKTNEATKKVKEPLEKGQTKPTEKQSAKQKQEQKPKGKTMKM